MCKLLSIKHVAEHYGLGWDAVKAIDKAAMEMDLGEIDLCGLRVLLIDEFAPRKGHRYATVVMDGQTKRVLRNASEFTPLPGSKPLTRSESSGLEKLSWNWSNE